MRVLLTILILLSSIISVQGRAIPKYASPSEKAWANALKQPGNPTASCCGPANAYYADKVEPCTHKDFLKNEDCALVAIITDTRPNEDFIPYRYPIKVGTRVIIPKDKIRRHPSANPTDHNVVFLDEDRWVYCWEPLAEYLWD